MAEKKTNNTEKAEKHKVIAPQNRKTVFMLMVAVVSGFFGGWLGSGVRSRNGSLASQSQAVKTEVIMNESQVISQLVKNASPSVVSINVDSQVTGYDFFFGPTTRDQQSAGTGFIVTEDGLVVTNKHVVPDSAGKVSVVLDDGTVLSDIDIIGRDRVKDIAFLKIKDKKGKTLKPVKLGESNKLQVGDKVIAIGNALGEFQNTVTTGIISGLSRPVETDATASQQNYVQTDAAINFGNSGGPLMNINGEVIGINTAVAASSQGQAENIGFAIPIDDVKGLIKSVSDKGKLERPYLGVRYVMLNDNRAYRLNLSQKKGAYITPPEEGSNSTSSIVKDSPAEKAGLKEKDIITKINDKVLDTNNDLASTLSQYGVGDDVTLTIVRDDKEQQIKVKLEAAPQQ